MTALIFSFPPGAYRKMTKTIMCGHSMFFVVVVVESGQQEVIAIIVVSSSM